ncbi:hypothetical protein C3Y92_09545 [Solidesulfovibrio carbinolicus]|uniref:Helix-turn-helix domain-containing protein n=1 Tax=Solidesulfovibrio carbinolicus TaxID=296842 RepID=A0A4V0YQT8_9BACT|nr:hypothetical protein C3Y92_09545 [Solidesulfovibrio carbinolicus]
MQREEGAPKRFWARHKTQAVLRQLRGEDIDLVSRELGVTAATLSQWRDTFLEAGEWVSSRYRQGNPLKSAGSGRKSASRPWKTSCFARR